MRFNQMPSLVSHDPDINVKVSVPVIDAENANENILQNTVPKDAPGRTSTVAVRAPTLL